MIRAGIHTTMRSHTAICLILMMLGTGCRKPYTRTPHRLEGTWKSDQEQSVKWNREHATLTEEQMEKVAPLWGHMTTTFLPEGKGTITIESYNLKAGVHNHNVKATTNAFTYLIGPETADAVMVEIKSDWVPNQISTYHFEGADLYWIPLNESKDAPREYFRRIKEAPEP